MIHLSCDDAQTSNIILFDEVFENWNTLNWSQYSLIIQLAPINELMNIYMKDITSFNEVKLAIYASFNIRSVLNKYDSSQVFEMLNSFKQVLYYESFSKNAMHSRNLRRRF